MDPAPTPSLLPSSLDPPETPLHQPDSPTPCPPNSLQDEFTRDLVIAALNRLAPGSARLRRYTCCGETFTILRSTTRPQTYKFARVLCHDRLCPVCARVRAATLSRNLDNKVAHTNCRFITLTIRSHPKLTLDFLLRNLFDSFRALRRSRLWRDHVRGGVAFLEVTHSDQHGWHPHLHVLAEGNYLPQAALARAWSLASAGSNVVDIRYVYSRETVTRYVTSYTTKAVPPRLLERPSLADELTATLRSRKTVSTFGTWRKLKLLRSPTVDAWQHIATEAEIWLYKDPTDPFVSWARSILGYLHGQRDLEALITPSPDGVPGVYEYFPHTQPQKPAPADLHPPPT